MRFLKDGSDIPDDLIRASMTGEVLFLCGAGVSIRVGLPSFEGLTNDLYAKLGETPDNEAAEKIACGRQEYDRALRSLEKRTHRPGTGISRVREETVKLLETPKDAELPDHLTLLKLSRDKEGRPRLLTTNFDTLFERAAIKGGLDAVSSHANKSLPKPGGPRDYGVLHLHGRISDKTLSLEETDIVLTSADFGDAYLRDGWASQYIEDRIRLTPLVLVGYRAEDTALRLLLETLDVDRERFKDLKNIYALDQQSDGSASLWNAKGIESVEFKGHNEIYATLTEWARFLDNPTEYSRKRLQEILGKTPDKASDFEKEQVEFFMKMEGIPAIITGMNPSLAWLAVLKFDECVLASWVERNFSNVQAIQDVVANIHLFGLEAAELLEFRLKEQKDLSPLLAKSWRIIIQNIRNVKRGLIQYEWYTLLPRIRDEYPTSEILERIASFLRPKLSVKKKYYLGTKKEDTPEEPTDLMSIDFEVDDEATEENVLSAWPQEATAELDVRLLTKLTQALDSAIESAVDAGVENNGGYSLTDTDVPSIASHSQNEHHSGFLAITRVVAEIWQRLANKNRDLALPFLERWKNSHLRLYRRIALFACTNPTVSGDKAADTILALSPGELFFMNSSVEVYQLFRTRWNDFPQVKREEIERRICAGPSADLFRDDIDKAKLAEIIEHASFELLGSLERDDCTLGVASRTQLQESRARYPDWGLRPSEQTGFHIWHGGVVVAPSDLGTLTGVSDEQLIQEAQKIEGQSRFGLGNVWSELCKSDAERALRGLTAQSKINQWPPSEWQQFLRSREAPKPPDAIKKTAELFVSCPPSSFLEIADAASFWLNENIKAIDEELLWPLWDKIYEASSRNPNGAQS